MTNKELTKEQQHDIYALKQVIVPIFTTSDWVELSFMLGCHEAVDNHPRLLRSMDWGDPDYDGNSLEVLAAMVKNDEQNLTGIKTFIAKKYPEALNMELISTAAIDPQKQVAVFSAEVFKIPQKPQNDNLVVVLFPFKFPKTFDAIKYTCVEIEIECLKADDIWENQTFIQDIFDLIYTSRVIVADFTGRNANVFYEVGIAQTLGKTVIPITQNIDDVPSDLKHHRVLIYHPNEQGYRDLSVELDKRLRTLIPEKSWF